MTEGAKREKELNEPLGSVSHRPRCPKWILDREGISQRQWRSRKRKELKKVIDAFDEYRMGCFYCPGRDGEIGLIDETLKKLRKMHSCKEWGY